MKFSKLFIFAIGLFLISCGNKNPPSNGNEFRTKKLDTLFLFIKSETITRSETMDLNIKLEIEDVLDKVWVPKGELLIGMTFNDEPFYNFTCETTLWWTNCTIQDAAPGVFKISAKYFNEPKYSDANANKTITIDPIDFLDIWTLNQNIVDADEKQIAHNIPLILEFTTNNKNIKPTGTIRMTLFNSDNSVVDQCETKESLEQDSTKTLERIGRFQTQCNIPELKVGKYFVRVEYSGNKYYLPVKTWTYNQLHVFQSIFPWDELSNSL